jgi:hypothetical protein
MVDLKSLGKQNIFAVSNARGRKNQEDKYQNKKGSEHSDDYNDEYNQSQMQDNQGMQSKRQDLNLRGDMGLVNESEEIFE